MSSLARKYGLLTELQYRVLELRLRRGLSQAEAARVLGTSRENVAIAEKRALRNIELAERTISFYRYLLRVAEVVVEPGTHLVDIPSMVVKAGDTANVKVAANFTRIYDEVRFKARDCIEGRRVVRPIRIAVLRDGSIEVICEPSH
ncbi:MAG: Tfx family DNA-binding protein [Fervidicoccaceae archaeon]|nr:Tfx family DNA-binding protein [Fervidicoccaceae archaeon]